MAAKLNLDKLDLQIIHHMMENAEISYAELGKKLFVSGGTIHVRIKKLQEAGVVKNLDMMSLLLSSFTSKKVRCTMRLQKICKKYRR
jgi:Lrp/AsnC family transcriptional regulator for asnA, asnC and gidA